ncbi:MAG: hypothetical protein FJ265_17190 [Planctomycetes bacterium]|nr:hypothetical protein [Planctomycetota bacterium]
MWILCIITLNSMVTPGVAPAVLSSSAPAVWHRRHVPTSRNRSPCARSPVWQTLQLPDCTTARGATAPDVPSRKSAVALPASTNSRAAGSV